MAIAPEQIGIGIRRYFTRPETHPYDMVEWERREARIQNYKDGTDAFFQPDVEFPASWSQNATNIVAQKYFRGTLGTAERETSLRQVIDRIADTITAWGVRDGYFVDDHEGAAFRNELKYILLTQRAAFNSPVWFNIGVKGVPQQASACFILAVEDTMDGILNWYREEGTIFKGGSGSGINLSGIRSSLENLKGGGTASGPVSFMRGADASAGTIKSGGKTRRAAKMVILNADHPDVEEFIWCKAIEERKARALADAGFDMDLDGKDCHSIQYQNANNSVRVTDEFMQAVLDDNDWDLIGVTTGEPLRRVKARDLMRQISESAWECADPGMQFDTTINRWHTAPNTGRINGCNPCSEYMHIDNSACNLASINLLKYLDEDARVRRRRVRAHRRGDVHRAGDPGRQRRLPDRADRREQPQVPPARPRLRQPRRAADGAGHGLRLRRRACVGGGDHRADDRPRVRHQRAHRGAHGPVRRLRRERRSRCSTCCACTAPRSPRSTRSWCRRSCSAPRSVRGTTRSSWARRSVCATRRPPCSRPPARSGS